MFHRGLKEKEFKETLIELREWNVTIKWQLQPKIRDTLSQRRTSQ